MSTFLPQCLPLLIGSLPFEDHDQSARVIFDYTPQIPLWPQLPVHKNEGMILQYLPGMPGVTESGGKVFIDSQSPEFEAEQLAFYEEFLMISEGGGSLDDSRFAMSGDEGKGFCAFLEVAEKRKDQLVALKGQTTGPITFCTALTDQSERAVYYDEQLRDVAVKHLAQKARWQTRKMSAICDRALMFFDEPGLAGLGTSAFITLTKEEIIASLSEVFDGVRAENGLTGIHVCANTEWPVLFESGVDIISFDAYSYFDRLVLYADHIKEFLGRGGILASGIVPTSPEFVDKENADSLVIKWFDQLEHLKNLGIEEQVIYNQSLITPSCGAGTVSREQAYAILEMTKVVSEKVRSRFS